MLEKTITGRARWAAAVAAAGLVVAAALVAAPGAATKSKPKLSVAQQLLSGKPLDSAVIHGALKLPPTVDEPFECTHCRFDGPLLARDVVFKRTVNLRGSEFKGPVDMRGATFEQPALFSLAATFDEQADFSLATFDDTAGFDTSDFTGAARFQLARFRDTADFGESSFESRATFGGVQFSKAGLFIGASFGDQAAFDHATGAEIDFTFATLSALTDLELVTAGTLSLRHVEFDSPKLVMNDIAVTNLVMDPADMRFVNKDARGLVLDLIQSSAKARNDLGTANDAYYRIRERRGNSWGPVGHVLDVVFYRWVAGYLVVPWRPLIVLVLLAVLVALWRSRRVPVPPPAESDGVPEGGYPGERRRRLVPVRISRWGHELLDGLTLIVPRLGGSPTGRRFEAFVYRVLFVCMLFGFANSNPTLRQMLDAIL